MCFCLRVRRGGPKGHLTWPPNPPFCLIFIVVCFFFFGFRRRNLFSPLKKGHFCLLFSVSLYFLPSFLFYFPFALSLSLSLSCYFLSSFFSFFVAFFCFLVFVSLFLCLVSLLLFQEKNNIKISNCNFYFSSILSVPLVPVLFCL